MISSLLILVRIIEVTSIFQPDKSHHFFLAEKMYTQKNLLKATIAIDRIFYRFTSVKTHA